MAKGDYGLIRKSLLKRGAYSLVAVRGRPQTDSFAVSEMSGGGGRRWWRGTPVAFWMVLQLLTFCPEFREHSLSEC